MTAPCSCVNVIKTHSTVGPDFNLDVFGNRTPFCTANKRVGDTGGLV
ncbi:hypothetical protein [Salmonella enterica]